MTATIKSAVAEAAETLRESGIGEPRGEAGLLLMDLLKCERAFLLAHEDQTLSSPQFEQYRALVIRRADGWPLQYLTGHQEFYRLDFEVTPDVLIPRPETELIVEAALPLLKTHPTPRFADVGTGSGCIAISLLHELPSARAVAADAAGAALVVARRNAERHRGLGRLRLVGSDLLSAIDSDGRLHVIVLDPP